MRTSWLTGEFESSGRRLDEVIQEFNRYNEPQRVINDPAVTQMKVGGHYVLTDVDGFGFVTTLPPSKPHIRTNRNHPPHQTPVLLVIPQTGHRIHRLR